RFILHRDARRCTISGCTSRYRLQIHHIDPWSDGGRTDPENLTTLCWFHHHVVIHGQGHRIDPTSPPQRRRLLNPQIHAPPARAKTRVA
ncbi:MAG: HNH endonuclease, partial [Acidimicrobiia bacterium]